LMLARALSTEVPRITPNPGVADQALSGQAGKHRKLVDEAFARAALRA
jgi:hypothetical protein